MGLESFAKNYLGESMGFRTGPTNSMEVAADLFACKYYPNGYANYLPGGVCPI
jgi:hypothetical protein